MSRTKRTGANQTPQKTKEAQVVFLADKRYAAVEDAKTGVYTLTPILPQQEFSREETLDLLEKMAMVGGSIRDGASFDAWVNENLV